DEVMSSRRFMATGPRWMNAADVASEAAGGSNELLFGERVHGLGSYGPTDRGHRPDRGRGAGRRATRGHRLSGRCAALGRNAPHGAGHGGPRRGDRRGRTEDRLALPE